MGGQASYLKQFVHVFQQTQVCLIPLFPNITGDIALFQFIFQSAFIIIRVNHFTLKGWKRKMHKLHLLIFVNEITFSRDYTPFGYPRQSADI